MSSCTTASRMRDKRHVRLYSVVTVLDIPDYVKYIKEFIEATEKEPGCVSFGAYHLVKADRDKAKIHWFGHFRSLWDLQTHCEAPHTKAFQARTRAVVLNSDVKKFKEINF